MRLLLTSGAKRNVGDFLIHHRARQLFAAVLPHAELVSVPRWQACDEDLLRRSSGVIACGGPGLAPDLLERMYVPLGQALRLGRPASILGVGLGPATAPPASMFGAETLEAVRGLLGRGGVVTTRDWLSAEQLASTGVQPVEMTGCPAWYHPPTLGAPLWRPTTIRSLVVTTPARPENLARAAELLEALAARFPNAERHCVLHRGLPMPERRRAAAGTARLPSRGSVVSQGRALATHLPLLRAARRTGFRIVNAAGDLNKIGFYGDADFHVGYRVHAHIDFLSRRRPSILIAEDIRGQGQFGALGDRYELMADDPALVEKVTTTVSDELGDFPSSEAAVETMQARWPIMSAAVERIAEHLS